MAENNTLPTAEQTTNALREHVRNNDAQGFNEAYAHYLQNFPAFAKATEEREGGKKVHTGNPIFNQPGLTLNGTTDDDAKQLLSRGRTASRVWSQVPLEKRVEFISELEASIQKRGADIQLTITADTGKPLDIAAGEMKKGNDWFAYTRQEAVKQLTFENTDKVETHTPALGVAQIIGAYNYPYALAIGGIVGALAGGNSIVVQGASTAPNWVFPFKDAADEAISNFIAKNKGKTEEETPKWLSRLEEQKDNLVNINVGRNEYLTANADVVHFVGSTETGEKKIKASRELAKGKGKDHTILEMGGTNVVAVMNSAFDGPTGLTPDKVAEDILAGFGPATGQRCTAPRLICIQEKGDAQGHCAEDVAAALKALCENPGDKANAGNPFEKGTKMGPLVDENAYGMMQGAISLAKKLGATVSMANDSLDVSPNEMPQVAGGARFVHPVVIDWGNVNMDSLGNEDQKRLQDTLKNEIFGPMVQIVHRVKGLDEAIATTNTYDDYNKLAGSIFCKTREEAMEYQLGTGVTSITMNGSPKDRSGVGQGVHGHSEGGHEPIGGKDHFRHYVKEPVTLARA